MARIVEEIILKVKLDDKSANKRIETIGTSAKKTTKQVNLLGDALKLVSAGVVIAGLKRLGSEAINLSNQFERVNNVLLSTFKTQGEVEAQMAFLSDTADRLGINLLKSAEGYAKLASSAKIVGLSTKDTQLIFEATAEATVALGLSADDTNGILRAFSQIAAKGKVQAEELMQINERGIPIQALMAKALGVSNEELQDMAAKGEILSVDALPKMAQAIRDTFHEGALKNANSELARAERRLNTYQEALKLGGGELKVFTSSLGDSVANGWEAWLDVASDAMLAYVELIDNVEGFADANDSATTIIKKNTEELSEQEKAVKKLSDSYNSVFDIFQKFRDEEGAADMSNFVRQVLGLTEEGFKKIKKPVEEAIKKGLDLTAILEQAKLFLSNTDLDQGDLIKDVELDKAKKLKEELMGVFDFLKKTGDSVTLGLFSGLGEFDDVEVKTSKQETPQAGLELGSAQAAEFLIRPTEDTNKIAKESLGVQKKSLAEQKKQTEALNNQNSMQGHG